MENIDVEIRILKLGYFLIHCLFDTVTLKLAFLEI